MAMPPPSSPLTMSAMHFENHSDQSGDSHMSGTTLTSEDFDTLSAVLDDTWG
jgi:hypothetical protein